MQCSNALHHLLYCNRTILVGLYIAAMWFIFSLLTRWTHAGTDIALSLCVCLYSVLPYAFRIRYREPGRLQCNFCLGAGRKTCETTRHRTDAGLPVSLTLHIVLLRLLLRYRILSHLSEES
jgi:hypothetical protein